MIIKKLLINNFRSYYGEKVFVFGDRLNLILGSNGDGKSTFFEALNWVLSYEDSTNDHLPENASLVSAKYFEELTPDKIGTVSVYIELENNSREMRGLERRFSFKKLEDGLMKIERAEHEAYILSGVKKTRMPSVRSLLIEENVMPAMVKKYCLFKGEDRLDIFKDITTLQTLIDLYSDIRDMEPYKAFGKYATEKAADVSRLFKNRQSTRSKKQNTIQNEIDELNRLIEEQRGKLSKIQDEYDDLSGRIDAISDDIEILSKVHDLKKEATRFKMQKASQENRINGRENYGTALLDNLWILYNMDPIVKDYQTIMTELAQKRRIMERDYEREQIRQQIKDEARAEVAEELKAAAEYIPINSMEQRLIREMMADQRCKFCGTEAPVGSDAYRYMQNLLQKALDSIAKETTSPRQTAPKREIEFEPLFKLDNINPLKELGDNKYTKIYRLMSEMENRFAENDSAHHEIERLNVAIEAIDKEISETMAKAKSGEVLDENVERFAQIKNWYTNKEVLSLKIKDLEDKTIPDLEARLQQKRKEYQKQVENTKGSQCLEIEEFLNLFNKALEEVERSTYDEFLADLKRRANDYLELLNVDDFTGVISIVKHKQKLGIVFEDDSNRIITNPNTSLLTTVHISLLLAIAEITKECKKNEYPLIFDAPTSSFDEGKDRSFYQCLNQHVDKQCIVATKSFLHKNSVTGEFEVDYAALSQLDCTKFRIKKLSGFDKKDLTTIDTLVENLN